MRAFAWIAGVCAGLGALGCGAPEPGRGPGLNFSLAVSGIAPATLSAFQVTVLATGANRCASGVDKNACLSTQLAPLQLVMLHDAQGDHRSLRFPAGGAGTQDVAVTLPVGVKYTFWVEALSRDTPPVLLGNGCDYRDIAADDSTPLQLQLLPVATVPACDPRID